MSCARVVSRTALGQRGAAWHALSPRLRLERVGTDASLRASHVQWMHVVRRVLKAATLLEGLLQCVHPQGGKTNEDSAWDASFRIVNVGEAEGTGS